MMQSLGSVFMVAAGAVPDAITAGIFLFAWLYPMEHPGLPAMLVEFLAVHSGGMLAAFAWRVIACGCMYFSTLAVMRYAAQRHPQARALDVA